MISRFLDLHVVEDYCKWCVQSRGQSAEVGLREALNRRDAYLVKARGHAPAPEGKATHGFPARGWANLVATETGRGPKSRDSLGDPREAGWAGMMSWRRHTPR